MVFLVKHLPAGTTTDELRELFDRYGTIGRLLLPPQGLTAIIEYIDATEARTAFRALAYTKVTGRFSPFSVVFISQS